MVAILPQLTIWIGLSNNFKIFFEIKVIETPSHLVSLASTQDFYVDELIEVPIEMKS